MLNTSLICRSPSGYMHPLMSFQLGLIARRKLASPVVIRVLLGLLTLFTISPFFLTLRPPLQDFPQHLAAGHVLLEPTNPELRFSDYFTSQWLGSQYLGIYVLLGVFHHPLSWFVDQPLLLASRLSIIVLVLAWAASGEWLGCRLLRRPGLGLFFLVLFFNAHLILGFLNFLLGTASCFVTLALFAHVRAKRAAAPASATPRHLVVLLAVAALATFYFHVVPFAMVLAVFGVSFFVDAVVPRLTPRFTRPRHGLATTDYLACLPALLALGMWLFSPAGQSTRQAAQGGDDKLKAVFTSAEANTAAIDAWLLDVFRSEWDTKLMYIAVGALALYIVFEWTTSLVARRTRTEQADEPDADVWLLWLLRLGAPACAVAYYVAPASYDWIWPINARFPLLALLLLPFWLPVSQADTRQGWLRLTRQAALLVCTITMSVAAAGETLLAREAFRGFATEMEGLDQVLSAIPKGKKVATLVFDRGSRYVAFSPFLHVGAYYQAERGGVSYFSFNDFPQSPVRFLPDDRPPKAKPRWEWKPEAVRPDDELGWFDYLIVRGGPATLRGNQTFDPIRSAGRFRLFKNHQIDDEDEEVSP